MAESETEVHAASGDELGQGAAEMAGLGQPDVDTRSTDVDRDWDIAKARDPHETRAAYQRGLLKVEADRREAAQAVQDDPDTQPMGKRGEEYEQASQAREEARQRVHDQADEAIQKLRDRYAEIKPPQNDVEYNRSDVDDGEREIERHGIASERTPQGRESAAMELADRAEEWAKLIHDNPDAAGDWTPQTCINVEAWIDRHSDTLRLLERELSAIRERIDEGGYRVDQAVQDFETRFGYEREPSNRTEEQIAFLDLLGNDETTVGQVKEFLLKAYTDRIDGWRKAIDDQQGRLDAIRGTTPPERQAA